jgi:hypothetical protein
VESIETLVARRELRAVVGPSMALLPEEPRHHPEECPA